MPSERAGAADKWLSISDANEKADVGLIRPVVDRKEWRVDMVDNVRSGGIAKTARASGPMS